MIYKLEIIVIEGKEYQKAQEQGLVKVDNTKVWYNGSWYEEINSYKLGDWVYIIEPDIRAMGVKGCIGRITDKKAKNGVSSLYPKSNCKIEIANQVWTIGENFNSVKLRKPTVKEIEESLKESCELKGLIKGARVIYTNRIPNSFVIELGIINYTSSIDNLTIDGKMVYQKGEWFVEKEKPLFTTRDGKKVYKGDKCWYALAENSFKGDFTLEKRECNGKAVKGKYFSSREAGEEYIRKYIFHKEYSLKYSELEPGQYYATESKEHERYIFKQDSNFYYNRKLNITVSGKLTPSGGFKHFRFAKKEEIEHLELQNTKKKYEVLSVKGLHSSNKGLFTLNNNSKLYYHESWNSNKVSGIDYNILLKLLDKDVQIYSVKRLTDGEIFTIGDKVKNPADNSFTISKFYFDCNNDKLLCNGEFTGNGHISISKIEKVTDTKFTFGGEEISFNFIKEGGERYFYNTVEVSCKNQIGTHHQIEEILKSYFRPCQFGNVVVKSFTFIEAMSLSKGMNCITITTNNPEEDIKYIDRITIGCLTGKYSELVDIHNHCLELLKLLK